MESPLIRTHTLWDTMGYSNQSPCWADNTFTLTIAGVVAITQGQYCPVHTTRVHGCHFRHQSSRPVSTAHEHRWCIPGLKVAVTGTLIARFLCDKYENAFHRTCQLFICELRLNNKKHNLETRISVSMSVTYLPVYIYRELFSSLNGQKKKQEIFRSWHELIIRDSFVCIRYNMVYSGLYECNEYNPL